MKFGAQSCPAHLGLAWQEGTAWCITLRYTTLHFTSLHYITSLTEHSYLYSCISSYYTMATVVPSKTAVLHAYRHLFRQGLKAIRYSAPGRYTLRTIIRRSFRSPSEQFDASRIANTLRFLERATAAANMEHRIVKNILITRYWETTPIGKDSRM